jgi:hypothetical protein
MALTVEDGTGITGADSPNSLEEITAYCAARPRMAGWASLSEARQEAAARDASRRMEKVFRHRITGRRVTADQGLSFPSAGAWDARGLSILGTSVPAAWKEAHCEMTYRVAFEEQAPIESVSDLLEEFLFDLVQPAGKVLVQQGWA